MIKIAVVGGGIFGCTIAATIARKPGVEVHLFEMLPTILPIEDTQASAFLTAEFKRKKMKVYTSTKISQVDKTESGLKLTCIAASDDESSQKIKRPDVLEVDQLLVAVGVKPNSANFGLENAGVETENGFIKIDRSNASYQTNVAGIHAIGDVSGMPLLAHKASHEGTICVQWIAHKEGKLERAPESYDYNLMPGVTFTEPEIASVGMNEKSAIDAGYEVKIGQYPYSANGRAAAAGENRGFVKLIFDKKTDKLLGGVVAGTNAGEVLTNIITPLSFHADVKSIGKVLLPHPTLGEMITEAARIADGVKLL